MAIASPSFRAAVVFTAVLCCGCPNTSLVRASIDDNCGSGEELKRIEWSIRYMRAAARSRAFASCLHSAVTSVKPLMTAQESIWVGPYFSCKATAASGLRDPQFAIDKPALGYEAALALAQTQERPLQIRCGSAGGATSTFGKSYDYFDRYEGDDPEIVELSLKVFSEYPDHQQGVVDKTEYGNLDPSYTVDELAGIILHERLHVKGFHHGSESNNECGYTSGFNCPATGVPANCRMRSLNEIAEACMSEVVEDSIGWCAAFGASCSDPNSVPIFVHKVSNTEGTCECLPWY